MENNLVGSLKTNETHQSNNDNYEQCIETFNNSTINDNEVFENDSSNELVNNSNFNDNDSWEEEHGQTNNQYADKDHSGHYKGRGDINKSNNSWDSSKKFQNNSGRGRGFNKRYNNDRESFGSGNNPNDNEGGYPTPGYRGRGRGQHRGRGGRFRDNSNDSWNENREESHQQFENDKFSAPKPLYIPPDIESEESIAGIEAGQYFDDYEKIKVEVDGNDIPQAITSFPSSGLRNILLENIAANHYSKPTPIQKHAIPIVIAGRDLMGSAQTGSGKTAAFVLPILHNLLNQPSQLIFDENHSEPQVVILAPTRELAIQISECVWKLSKRTDIRNKIVYGGTSSRHQKIQVLQSGVHILTATPGRLIDFVDQGIITFSSVRFFVLDEADRMLDMGFRTDIERILQHSTMTPNDARQTLMFSATFPKEIQHMALSYLKPDYIKVAVGATGEACKHIVQTVNEVKRNNKKKALLNLLQEMGDCQGTIVFVEQKRVADYTACYLSEMNFPTTSIHGDREQPERELALKDFKMKKMKILVATAVAARGIDIIGVNYVVNYDLPKTIDEYVHRIGRTGRLGNVGKAISFFDPESDGAIASALITTLKQADQEIPSWLNDAAEYAQANPSSVDDFNDIRTNVEVTTAMVAEDEW